MCGTMLHSITIGDPTAVSVAVLHGILGSGRNWRSFCQRLLQRRADLRFVLIDLRNHGGSDRYSSPNGLLQCAEDIQNLQKEAGSFSAIIGHSFGGKVALQCSDIFPDSLKEVWALDSNPGILVNRDKDRNEVIEVFRLLESIPMPVQKRSEVRSLLQDGGASREIARWMVTNLQREAAGYYWSFHLPGVREMIEDYFKQDLWSFLEKPKRSCHILRALKSDRWTKDDIQRLENLGKSYHCLDAGHWVHADNPEGLLDILSVGLLP